MHYAMTDGAAGLNAAEGGFDLTAARGCRFPRHRIRTHQALLFEYRPLQRAGAGIQD
jgi:hypothetical protein